MINKKIMKQTKHVLLVLMAWVMSAAAAFSQTVGTRFTVNNITYQITKKDLTTHDNEVSIYRVSGSGTVSIPATVTNEQDKEVYKVISTVEWASPTAMRGVTDVILPEGFKSITAGCFNDCPTMKSITIPSTCTSIHYESFENNPVFSEFKVTSGNPTYAANADGLLLSNGGTKIEHFPSGKSGDYTIPSTVTSIGRDAFASCRNLGKLTIPESVTDIYFSPFNNKSSIYGSATYIDVAAGNINYKSIDGVLYAKTGNALLSYPYNYSGSSNPYIVAEGTSEVMAYAFYNSNVISIRLNDVATIDPMAFKSSSQLTSVTFGANVSSIGEGSFSGCTKLTAFDVDPNNSKYKATDGVIFTKDGKQLVLYPSGKAGNYAIPEGTVTVANQAFYNAAKLGNVTVPTTLTEIGTWAFGYCSLTGLTFTATSSLQKIGTSAFTGTKLTTVTLPASVETIENSAFNYVDNLQSVYIEDGSKLTKINYQAFANNQNLTTFQFLGSTQVTTIETNAFYNDIKLTSFVVPSTVTTIQSSAFQNTPAMTTVTFEEPASITTIGTGAFAYSGITSIDLPESVTKLETQAFDNCSALTTVNIPKNLTDIGMGAFNKCDGILNFTVDADNPTYSALAGMLTNKDKTALEVFPAGQADSRYTLIPKFTTVKPYAFYGSKKLDNITFPASVTEIGDRAIALCENLKSLSFMGTDNVPTLTADIMYESGNTKNITIYVRKAWYEKPANASTVSNYNTTFKEVHPSFVPETGYDRGTEFFPTSTTNVGVISFFEPRTSVIIDKAATETTYTDVYGKIWPTKTYTVSSILDYAYQNQTTVQDIVILSDIGVIGLNAFKAGSQLQGIYFVGNTPAELNSTDYDMNATDYPFNANQAIYVKRSKVNDYKNTWEVENHTLNITCEIPQKTNSYGATRSYPFDVQFNNSGDVRPYLPVDFSHMNAAEPYAKARRIDDGYVPAFLGVLLHSMNAASSNSYCEMTDAQDHAAVNDPSDLYSASTYKMVAVVEDTQVMSDANYTLYAFSKSQGKFLKIKTDPGNKMPYFSAYLKLDGNNQAKAFSFRFDDGSSTTGVESIKIAEESDENAPYYNLNGMRVDNPAKGVYIRNGKKVIIK